MPVLELPAELNFGKIITLGDRSVRPLNIKNIGEVKACLVLDLRPQEFNPDGLPDYECLEITAEGGSPLEQLKEIEEVNLIEHLVLEDDVEGDS